MKSFLSACIILIAAAQPLATSGIQFFSGTFREAIVKATAEKKPIFLDAFAEWCGPCKGMDRDVYADKEVGAYMNAHFICVKVDMEKGEGPELMTKLPSIDGYPSLLFFNPEGHLSKTILGSRNAEVFLSEARLVVKEQDLHKRP